LRQNEVGIARDTHGVGGHSAHLLRGEAPQLLAEATQSIERALLRGMVENSLSGQAGSKANTLFEVCQAGESDRQRYAQVADESCWNPDRRRQLARNSCPFFFSPHGKGNFQNAHVTTAGRPSSARQPIAQ
jgi:hypothetical protein